MTTITPKNHNKAQTFFPNLAIITIINKVCATRTHNNLRTVQSYAKIEYLEHGLKKLE